MSPSEKARLWLADLARKLAEDVAAAEQQAVTAAEALSRVGTGTPDLPTMALLSICIDRAYTAIESGLVRIARFIDENAPTGDDWHQALLQQMTLAIQDRRAEILSTGTAKAMDPLRRHRHWLRHAYAASFEWKRMEHAARSLTHAVAMAAVDLRRFLSNLETG